MKRIAIIGCSGAGKSTLAVTLSALLGIEVHHLDRVFLDVGGPKAPRERFRSLHATLLEQPAWIIDGNFGGLMDARFAHADTIIFLDLPVHSCLWGAFRRKVLSCSESGHNNKEGNPNKLTWGRMRYILLRHRRRHRPAILGKIEAARCTKRVIVLKSRAEVRAFLQGMADQGCAQPADAAFAES